MANKSNLSVCFWENLRLANLPFDFVWPLERTVIERRQQHLGRMADILWWLLLLSGVLSLQTSKILWVMKYLWDLFWLCSLKSLASEVTPSATHFFKRAYKISHPPRLWVSWTDFLALRARWKFGLILVIKFFFSWSYEKVILTKNVRLTYYSSMKKKIRKIRMIFDIENSLWKSNFRTLRRAGKARQSIPGRL